MNNNAEHKAVEQLVADKICAVFKCDEIQTGSDAAPADRLFYRDGKVVAVAEIKGRNRSIEELEKWGTYMITEDKLTNGQQLSSLLHVPFYILAYLKESKKIAMLPITDARGHFVCQYDTKRIPTKANCDGGTAVRENAFIHLDQMKLYD